MKVAPLFHAFNLENQITQRWPVAMPVIALGLVGVHAALGWGQLGVQTLVDAGAVVMPATSNVMRLVTYSGLHANVLHLANNVVTLVVFGSYLEVKYRWWRLCVIYGVGCVAAALAYMAAHKFVHGKARVVMVGASGGVFGLMGAMVSEFYLNWERFTNRALRVATIGLIVASHAVEYVGSSSNVATKAHLGGLVYGVVPAVLYLPNHRWESWEWVFVVLAGVFHVVYFIIFPVYIFL